MNANEIVRALRESCTENELAPPMVTNRELTEAADLIESLQAEITQLKDELTDYNCDTKIGCKLIEEVKAERDAAVEDLRLSAIELKDGTGTCVVCKHHSVFTPNETCLECASGECKFEWRGPQADGEGERDE